MLITAKELLEQTKSETAEEAYRRGYHDAYVQAIGEIWDLMFKNKMCREKAYDTCFIFWQTKLCDWKLQAEKGFEVPPACTKE